jgi:tetratricopeptide (TPR) repeat protein
MLRNFGSLAALLVTCNFALAQATGPTPAEPKPAEPEKIDATTAAKILTATFEQTKDATSADDFSRVIEVCERALAAQPPEKIYKYAQQLAAWGYNRRGEVYADQAAAMFNQGSSRQANELDALALDDFESAVRHDPTKWKAIHNRGVSLALHGKVHAALADFTKALELNPDFVNSRFNRAEIRLQRGERDAAIEDYTSVLKLKADDTGALLGRGNALLRSDKLAEALADFNQALLYQPTSAVAYAGRGDVYALQGHWNHAGEEYRQAIRHDAQLGRAYRGAAWIMATCPSEQFRNAELALQSASKAIQLDGDGDWTYLDVLAAAQANAGKYAQAQATIEKALQIAPGDVLPTLQSRLALYRNRQPYRHSEMSAEAPRAALR